MLGRIILFSGEQQLLRTLAPSNFTQLAHTFFLHMISCGITSIERGTFDNIANTLRYLNLAWNRLKSIEPSLILVLLEVHGDRLRVHFDGNPLNCDCGVYEARSLLYAIYKHSSVADEIACKNKSIENSTLVCEHLQEIRIDSIKSNISGIGKYGFPKVNMRISDEDLIVNTRFTLKLRL